MAGKNYSGGCQCGAVRYDVANLDTAHTITCNCSRCGKLGVILAFAPYSAFKLLKGEDKLTEYKFNKGVISHLFCKICGVQSFARGKGPDGTEIAAINVRCLDGVDPNSLSPQAVNGAAI
jgi:hypothetical protein